MADHEGDKPLSKRRPLVVSAVILLLGILLGLLVPRPSGWPWAEPPPRASVGATLPFVLSDWEYPKAKSHTNLRGGSSAISEGAAAPRPVAFAPNLYAYSTPDSIEAVWGHYAKIAGIDKEFKPGDSLSRSDMATTLSSGGASSALGGILGYTGDPSRRSVRSATLVVQRPGYTVTVFITRSKDEDQTYINMVAEEKPAQLSP